MVKHSFSPDSDQHDPKIFKESLGSFGTTTVPGDNQLTALQAKVRQGIKHVELHLASRGKGQFNQQDVPDKYGFEQRRTIMQLAKLNQQTLSVHGTFDVNSFAGLGQGGFDESQRANAMKEIDETLKFAAETAKSGAVVFHLHETALPTPPGELNLPKKYIEKLKNSKDPKLRAEYDEIMKKHLNNDIFARQFQDNPDLEDELKVKYSNLDANEKKRLKDLFHITDWKSYFMYNKNEQIKLEQEGQPFVVVGSSLARVQRNQDLVNVNAINNLNSRLNEKELDYLKKKGISVDIKQLDVDDFQKIQATFSNGLPSEGTENLTKEEFESLRKKLVVKYEDLLTKNNRMKSLADKEFFQKNLDMQIKLTELQRADFETNYITKEDYLDKIRNIRKKKRELASEIREAKARGDEKRVLQIKKELNGGLTEEEQRETDSLINKLQSGVMPENERQKSIKRYQELEAKANANQGLLREELNLMYRVGQVEYQKLEKHDEYIAQFNEQIRKAKEQRDNAKVLTDEIFEKNSSSMGHLGLKALKYQLDLKKKSKDASSKLKEFNDEIKELEKKYTQAETEAQRNKLNAQIMKKRYDKRLWVGARDYSDVDVKNKALYLAPENIMAGYGYMDSLEEYKAVIRTSWDDFAKKLMSNESQYKKIREEYEEETGEKIEKYEDALKVAKRHIGGTFDNAHAGVWLKYFKRETGEREEHRIERFNKWLNSQAEEMAKEGIIKHIHFNDTQAKDDDHNLLGSGLLDIHDLRERLRRAGIKEPLIVEAGGRGGNEVMHVLNAFDIFNPTMTQEGYRLQGEEFESGSIGQGQVSDWTSVKRNYNQRPQYSQYGMGYSTFRHQAPQQGMPKGDWSGTGFL